MLASRVVCASRQGGKGVGLVGAGQGRAGQCSVMLGRAREGVPFFFSHLVDPRVFLGVEMRGGGLRLEWLWVGLDFGVGFCIISTRHFQIVLHTKQPASRIDFQENLGGLIVSGSRSVKAQVFRIYMLGQLCTRILGGGAAVMAGRFRVSGNFRTTC